MINRLITVSAHSCDNALKVQSEIQMSTERLKILNTAMVPTITFKLIDRYFNEGTNTTHFNFLRLLKVC